MNWYVTKTTKRGLTYKIHIFNLKEWWSELIHRKEERRRCEVCKQIKFGVEKQTFYNVPGINAPISSKNEWCQDCGDRLRKIYKQ